MVAILRSFELPMLRPTAYRSPCEHAAYNGSALILGLILGFRDMHGCLTAYGQLHQHITVLLIARLQKFHAILMVHLGMMVGYANTSHTFSEPLASQGDASRLTYTGARSSYGTHWPDQFSVYRTYFSELSNETTTSKSVSARSFILTSECT